MDNVVIKPLTQSEVSNSTTHSTFGNNKLVRFTHNGGVASFHVLSCNKATVNVVANSVGFSNSTNTIKISSADTLFAVGDYVIYRVPTSNTKIAGITTANAYYFVSFVNSSSLALSATSGGANLDITDARITNPGEVHTIALNKYQINLTGGQDIILEKDPSDTMHSSDIYASVYGTAIAYRN